MTDDVDLAKAYREHAYVVRPGMLDAGFCEYLTAYLLLAAQNGRLGTNPQIPGALELYGDTAFDVLLTAMAEVVAEHVGEEVIPTYSFARIYREGDDLVPHTDRPACEHSVTLHLGSYGHGDWPICLENLQGESIELPQTPGDALAYQGTRLKHWRPPFRGEWFAQVFLHWVSANGPHAGEQFDRRPNLGLPDRMRRDAAGTGKPT